MIIPAQPLLLDTIMEWITAAGRWLLDVIVALLTHRPDTGRHVLRDHTGADDAYAAELARMAGEREFGLFCGDLVPETVQWTVRDYLDAWPTMPDEYRDATDVALHAAARRAGDR